MIKKLLFISFLISYSLLCFSNIQLNEKYNHYRNKLISEWVVVSPNVEQFGTNIPAMDKIIDNEGKVKWVSWSDGNANFNHWLSFLACEYNLLKINNQDYTETLSMLLYSMFAIERLDLYSEYLLRKYHNIKESETAESAGYVKYPDDINGFMLRDDVTLGFWKQYHSLFLADYGSLNKRKDASNTYLSVYQKGVIPRQAMSQDNISYLFQALALIKKFVKTENIKDIELNFENNYIPDYLRSRNIWVNDEINFSVWVDDIVDRLISNMSHSYPEQKIVLRISNNFYARPSKNNFGKLLSSYWYIKNPVTNDLVAEGSGEDMGVFLNSYGFAEAADKITGKAIHHNDNSDKGLAKYLFKSLLFKNTPIMYIAAMPLPESYDDYMFRALTSVADINWRENSTDLLYLLRDKRTKWTYEHNPLILLILHNDKYERIYNNSKEYFEDKEYYENLLSLAPIEGPNSLVNAENFNIEWCSTSRLNWPHKINKGNYIYSGLDYLFLYNLFCTIFDSKNLLLNNNNKKNILFIKENINKYKKPEMNEEDVEYTYLPQKVN